MNHLIHSRFVASISDLKKNPMEVVNKAYGESVAILNRNTPVFYCVPAEMYEKLLDLVEDHELLKMTEVLKNEETVETTIDQLRDEVISKNKKTSLKD
ncbi:TPA: type II toxin-antitoxin system prevent-host-death family antitoxin [Acinetobacter baumannii]|nr:type II toxin-antitoxin system prevent-host-death family antitoxin [Acinetobacter baumannii]